MLALGKKGGITAPNTTMKPAHHPYALILSTAALALAPLAVADATATPSESAASLASEATPAAKLADDNDLAALVQQHKLAASPYPDVQRSWEQCESGAASYSEVLKAEEQSIIRNLQEATLPPEAAQRLLRQLERNAELQIRISRMLEQRQLAPAGSSDALAARLNETLAELMSRGNP